jgi:hypothetical protein
MEITQQEEVTRTYCDVCKKDITGGTKYGAGADKPEQTWQTCSGGEYILNEGHSQVLIPEDPEMYKFAPVGDEEYAPKAVLNCADIALLRFKYPELLTTG